MLAQFRSQFIDELRLHEYVVIGDVQADGSPGLHRLREFPPETIQVRFLHADNEIGPAEVAFGDDDAGVGLRSDGPRLKSGHAFEHLFRGQAAHAILAAHEQDLERF